MHYKTLTFVPSSSLQIYEPILQILTWQREDGGGRNYGCHEQNFRYVHYVRRYSENSWKETRIFEWQRSHTTLSSSSGILARSRRIICVRKKVGKRWIAVEWRGRKALGRFPHLDYVVCTCIPSMIDLSKLHEFMAEVLIAMWSTLFGKRVIAFSFLPSSCQCENNRVERESFSQREEKKGGCTRRSLMPEGKI